MLREPSQLEETLRPDSEQFFNDLSQFKQIDEWRLGTFRKILTKSQSDFH